MPSFDFAVETVVSLEWRYMCCVHELDNYGAIWIEKLSLSGVYAGETLMKRHFFVFLMGILMLLPLSLWAQEEVPSEDGMIEYEGTLYKMRLPNWLKVTGEMSKPELSRLPVRLSEQYLPNNSDVMFMHVENDGQKSEVFKDNINVVIVQEKIAFSDAFVSQLKTVLEQQYKDMFDNFSLSTIGMIKLGEKDALSIRAGYSIMNYNVFLMQVMIPGEKQSFVVTCTYDSQRDEEVSKICKQVFESFEIK